MNSITFVPVRHHSPACAMAVKRLAATKKFAAVLIEGPSDFNVRKKELLLSHTLPFAIFSYFTTSENHRIGAFYPFSEYSPEWQAIQVAVQQDSLFQFIDLSWERISYIEGSEENVGNLYNDRPIRESDYINLLCNQFGVNSFDDLWDELFESDIGIDPADFLFRVETFCTNSRKLSQVRLVDQFRESFMANEILKVQKNVDGPILVVTGGFHTAALRLLIGEKTSYNKADIAAELKTIPVELYGSSISAALIPYSYKRLDNLEGYQSGMPGPAFYQDFWEQEQQNGCYDHRSMLMKIANRLRVKEQIVSTADLIGGENACRILANFRGHQFIQRRDLFDGLKTVLIKDEVSCTGTHPLLEVIQEVFRGETLGKLDKKTPLPPLVIEVETKLKNFDLYPESVQRRISLNYTQESDIQKSKILHCLSLLEINGFTKISGPDFISRKNLNNMEEIWQIEWSPEFHSDLIEAARYGGGLEESVEVCLEEKINESEQKASVLAILTIKSALALPFEKARKLFPVLKQALLNSSDFLDLAKALDHLLYLFVFDQYMNYQINDHQTTESGDLLFNTWEHLMAMLEILGIPQNHLSSYLYALTLMLQCFERMKDIPEYSKKEFIDALKFFSDQPGQQPVLKGGVQGILWHIGYIQQDSILNDLKFFSNPSQIGDYLEGLFEIARELVQRNDVFFSVLDEFIINYTEEEFIEALPSLRLAFTKFSPREKNYLVQKVMDPKNVTVDIENRTFSDEIILNCRAFDLKVNELFDKYGLKGECIGV